MKKCCVFPGTFNPFTLGHKEIVVKALSAYEKIIVAVAEETYKDNVVPLDVRKAMAEKSLSGISGVDVIAFSGMLTDFLREIDCFEVVRGYRNSKDYEYEKDLEHIYVSMDRRVNFVLYESDSKLVSSNEVRRRVKENLDMSDIVDKTIIADIINYYKN